MEHREIIHDILKNYDINTLRLLEIIQNFLNNNTLVIVSGIPSSGKSLLCKIVRSFIKDFSHEGILAEFLSEKDIPILGSRADTKFCFLQLLACSDEDLQKYIDRSFLPGVNNHGYHVWVEFYRDTKLDLSKYNHIRLSKKQHKFLGNFKGGSLSDFPNILTELYTFEKEKRDVIMLCLYPIIPNEMIDAIIKLLY